MRSNDTLATHLDILADKPQGNSDDFECRKIVGQFSDWS